MSTRFQIALFFNFCYYHVLSSKSKFFTYNLVNVMAVKLKIDESHVIKLGN